MIKTITLIISLLFLLSGCAGVMYTLEPEDGFTPTWQPGHVISNVEPVLATWFQFYPFNYTKWEGLETFKTFSICLGAMPAIDEPKVRCLQMYWGVKIDGTESHALQKVDPKLWDYVYTPSEQWAFRLGNVGPPEVYNMGGS